jgi:hypothetical protein
MRFQRILIGSRFTIVQRRCARVHRHAKCIRNPKWRVRVAGRPRAQGPGDILRDVLRLGLTQRSGLHSVFYRDTRVTVNAGFPYARNYALEHHVEQHPEFDFFDLSGDSLFIKRRSYYTTIYDG